MRFDVEVVCEEVLPALRSIMASRLSEDFGLKQGEIAEKLGLTQPAVSQYLSGNRADHNIVETLEGDVQINLLIEDACSRAASDEDYSEELGRIITTLQDKGLLRERFSDTGEIM